MVTVTVPAGWALRRTVDGWLVPPGIVSDAGVALIDGVGGVPIVNVTALFVNSAGLPLSNALASAVCVPAARPVAVPVYAAVVSVATRLPSTRNSTRATAPPGSLAVAARFTLVVPAGKAWFAVGAVIVTCGGVLLGAPWIVNVTLLLALSDGLPLSNAVACA